MTNSKGQKDLFGAAGKPKSKPKKKHKVDRSDLENEIKLLVSMDPLERVLKTKEAAKRLDVTEAKLTQLVNQRLKAYPSPDPDNQFKPPEPWPDPVDSLKLFEDLREMLLRFCILPEGADQIIPLWILFAHAHDAFAVSPILAIQSPEKRCGKSTLLEVIALLTPKSYMNSGITPASLWRVMDAHQPTLLLDEADAWLGHNEDLRGALNAGHRKRGAKRSICVGDNHDLRQLSVWGPKVLAGIGTFPDTIQDRSLVIMLQRKALDQKVARFRERNVPQFSPLLRQAARWVADHIDILRDADPAMPETLNDRAQDNGAPLVAIADLISPEVGAEARQILVTQAKANAAFAEVPNNTQLLIDLHAFYATSPKTEFVARELIAQLRKFDESPWQSWHRGKPISARALAGILRGFGIQNHKTNSSRVYRVHDFKEVFERYLGPL